MVVEALIELKTIPPSDDSKHCLEPVLVGIGIVLPGTAMRRQRSLMNQQSLSLKVKILPQDP